MRTFEHPNGLVQRLAVADLTKGGAEKLVSMVPDGRHVVVYGDPPWSAGNEKYWRRYAKEEPPANYSELLDGWCRAAAALATRHIFCEQSVNGAHNRLFIDVALGTEGWHFPLLERWTVAYGSGKAKRPNLLLHFGHDPLTTDPTGMNGPKMTRRVFDGIDWSDSPVVVDPCMGLGMTSRLSHERGVDCVGTELNAKRLDRTIAWLLKKGYVEAGT